MKQNENTAWKILLIDDEADILEVTQMTLRNDGFNVIAAKDGVSGLHLCEEHQPQIVITDIRMPGMDGLEVLETLKKILPDIEVIVATAFGEMNLAIRALQLDASDFITKPIDVTALRLALQRAKDRYTSRKRLADYTALLEKENAETSRELVKTFQFQKNLIEFSIDGILGCDEKKIIVTFNAAMEKMTGYEREDVIGKKKFSDFFSPEMKESIESAFSREEYGGKNRLDLFETAIISKASKSVPVQISAIQLPESGKESGKVYFLRDLREIRKLEREVSNQARILHQDKMMSLGRLAASVVHEINNPLSGILNYLHLMIRTVEKKQISGDQQEKFKKYLKLVESETSRCSRIVSNLLTFSRKSALNFQEIRVEELLERCAVLSGHRMELGNIEFNYSVGPDLPPVYGDANQLQQCIINLIFNAIDAMPDGGRLYLSATFNPETGFVSISAEDTGSGISPENLPRIFEPFFTTKKEGFGVGLGLSTVYGIIQRHGGKIDVKSEKGRGTTFIIRIPVVEGKNG